MKNEIKVQRVNGNIRSVLTTMGARNYALEERETNDYYATDPKILELLLQEEKFAQDIWECSCGEGHLSKVLKSHGYSVLSTDIIDRGYGQGGVDFLQNCKPFDGDIITNPPYKFALEFAEKALEVVTEGHKVAMFLKLQFLEGKARRAFFEKCPPQKVYVSTSRVSCAKNGDFKKINHSAIAYAWFIWEKGYTGSPIIKWFN